jgi:hypothetical protein
LTIEVNSLREFFQKATETMSGLIQQTSISWNARGSLLHHARAFGTFFGAVFTSFLAAMHESRRYRAERQLQHFNGTSI